MNRNFFKKAALIIIIILLIPILSLSMQIKQTSKDEIMLMPPQIVSCEEAEDNTPEEIPNSSCLSEAFISSDEVKFSQYVSSDYFTSDYFKLSFDGKICKILGKTALNKTGYIFSVFNDKDKKQVTGSIDAATKSFSNSLNISTLPLGRYKFALYYRNSGDTTYWSTIYGIPLVVDTELYIPGSEVNSIDASAMAALAARDTKQYTNTAVLDITTAHLAEIRDKALEVTQKNTNDYDKIKSIHDWVADNIYYDYDAYLSGGYRYKDYSPYSVYTSKLAICQGYAELTEAMLRSIGIPAVLISGNVITASDQTWLAEHAWNAAFANGRWIILDTTWDSGNRLESGIMKYKGINSYTYFDPTLNVFSLDHKITSLPPLYISSISVKSPSDTVVKNGTMQMSTIILPDDADYKVVNWSIENGTGEARIDFSGLLEGKKPGTVTVKASASDGSGVVGSKLITVISNQYTISVKANNDLYGSVAGGGLYAEDQTVNVSAIPGDGYHFVCWTEGDFEVSADSDYSFTATGERTLVAVFAKNNINVAASSNNASYGSVTGGGSYYYNTAVTLNATANSGYHFVRWTEGDLEVSTDANYSFTPTRDITLVAVFERDEPIPPVVIPVSISCTITDATEYGAANGSITISASGGNSGGYEYSINGGSWQGSNNFGGLTAGAYTVAVCDVGDPSNTAACSVTISQPAHIGSVPANKVSPRADAGTAVTLVLPAAPKGYTTIGASFSSSNPAIATVDANGNVTFLAGGKVTIITTIVSQTADRNGKVKTKTTTVKKTITVRQPITSIALNMGSATIARKGKVKLAASIAPGTASNKKLKWTSSNPKIASVSGAGVVTGKTGGTAVITCRAQDGSGVSVSCTVTVTPIYPSGVKLSKTALTIKSGKMASLKATILPKNTDFKTVTWTSSNPGVATVDAKGKIKAVAPGTVVITATTSNGIAVSCTVIVQ